jgi:hypothetical protein
MAKRPKMRRLPYLPFGNLWELLKKQAYGMVGGNVVLAFKPAGDRFGELVSLPLLEGGSAS